MKYLRFEDGEVSTIEGGEEELLADLDLMQGLDNNEVEVIRFRGNSFEHISSVSVDYDEETDEPESASGIVWSELK